MRAALAVAALAALLPAVRFPDAAGRSGKLLAVIAAPEDVGMRPGIHPMPDGFAPSAKEPFRRSLIVLVPLSEKKNGYVGRYFVGVWPREVGASLSPGAAARAKETAYALPRGFVEVTKRTAATRLSEHFLVGDFLTHDQPDVWPKYEVLDMKLVDLLEMMIGALASMGHEVKGLHVMSGFRTPQYNAKDLGPKSRSQVSRHMYGDGADVFPDDDRDGVMDDLDGDGKVDLGDARIVAEAANRVMDEHPDLAGGVAVYPATAAHGPFVHVDTRGRRAHWGD